MGQRIILSENEKLNIRRMYGLINEQYYNPGLGMTPQASRDMGERFHNKKPVSADDAADVASAIIDKIPGIGNLVSMSIDFVHSVTYIYRWKNATDESSKIEYAILAILTFAIAFLPVGGNTINIAARKGISQVFRMTPDVLTKWAISKGIMKPQVLIQKGVSKYSILLSLARLFKNETAEKLSKIVSNIVSLQNIISEYKLPDFFVNGLDELKQYLISINEEEPIKIALEILEKSQDLSNFELTPN